jgi:preprotein translocase subunit YajC
MFSHLQNVALLLASQTQGQGEGGAGGCAGAGSSQMLMMALMMGILYFVWIRPAGNERKKHQAMLEALKRGDEVVTNSGMFGTIADMDEKTITLEVARNVKIKMLRSAISRPAAEPDKAAPKADESDKSSPKASKS